MYTQIIKILFSWALDPIVLPGASAARGQAAAFNPSRVVDWNTAVPGESGAAAHALAPNGDSIQSGDLGNMLGTEAIQVIPATKPVSVSDLLYRHLKH